MQSTGAEQHPDGLDALPVAMGLIGRARRIAVLTGAGTSTGSGIPDFRGPRGVWTTDPGAARSATLQAYLSDPQLRRRSWRNRSAHPAWLAQPNSAHHALAAAQRSGRLTALITQNIDGLHQRAGSAPVLELHGNLFGTMCCGCGHRGQMRDALDRVAAGEPDPACVRCGGILKSTTVSFGERLDQRVLAAARTAAARADLLLTLGTSLSVQPAAGVVGHAARQGKALIVCNAEPTPYDGLATAVLRGDLGVLVPQLLATLTGRDGGSAGAGLSCSGGR